MQGSQNIEISVRGQSLHHCTSALLSIAGRAHSVQVLAQTSDSIHVSVRLHSALGEQLCSKGAIMMLDLLTDFQKEAVRVTQ